MASPSDSPTAPEQLRKPRKALLPRWLLVVMGSVALLSLAGWWSQRPLARIRLPDGGELVLVEAQYGSVFQKTKRIGFAERLRHLFSRQRSTPLRQPVTMTIGSPTDPPSLWLVFDVGNREESLFFTTLDNGRQLENSQFSKVGGIAMAPRGIARLQCYPRRARHLELRISLGNQSMTAIIPNPFPVSDAPRWTPEPIPQTRQLGSGQIVLESLRFDQVIEAKIKIDEPGVPAGAFTVSHMFSDATGNVHPLWLPRSEPVWRVHTIVTPNAQYPFPASESVSFGHTTMPGPGEIRVLTQPPA